MAHRSREALLLGTRQSAAASRALSELSASSCRTAAWSRVIFFIGRCRSMRTFGLKDRRGGLRIQSTHRPASPPKAHRKKTCITRPRPRYRPSTPICGALNDGLRIPVPRWRRVLPCDESSKAWRQLTLDRTRALALFALRAGETKEVEMLNSMKSGVPEKDKNATASAPEVLGRTVQPHDQAWARSEPTTKAGTASCIGSDMSIVGKI